MNQISLISQMNSLPAPSHRNGESTLHFAIRKGDLTTVSAMLQNSGVEIDRPDEQNLTAIDHAFLSGNPKMQALVLGYQIGKHLDVAEISSKQDKQSALNIASDLKTLLSPDVSQFKALQTAAFLGRLDQITTLAPNSKILNHRSQNLLSPLQCAVLGNHVEMVNKLISLGADPCFLTRDRKSILHLAAATGNPKMVELVLSLKEPSLQINAMDKQGRTPLHYALVHEAPGAARALIQNGADPFFKLSAIPPLSVFIAQAQKRSNDRDPLRLDVGSVIMFAAIVGSWIVSRSEDAQALQSLASLASLLQLIPGEVPQPGRNRWLGLLSYPVIGFNMAPHPNGFSFTHWMQAFQTATVVKNWIQTLQISWTNRSIEMARPIRNTVIHSVNAFYFLTRFFETIQIQRFDFESFTTRQPKTPTRQTFGHATSSEINRKWEDFRNYCKNPSNEERHFYGRMNGVLKWQESCGGNWNHQNKPHDFIFTERHIVYGIENKSQKIVRGKTSEVFLNWKAFRSPCDSFLRQTEGYEYKATVDGEPVWEDSCGGLNKERIWDYTFKILCGPYDKPRKIKLTEPFSGTRMEAETKWTELLQNDCQQYFEDDQCFAERDGGSSSINEYKYALCNNGKRRPSPPPPPSPSPSKYNYTFEIYCSPLHPKVVKHSESFKDTKEKADTKWTEFKNNYCNQYSLLDGCFAERRGPPGEYKFEECNNGKLRPQPSKHSYTFEIYCRPNWQKIVKHNDKIEATQEEIKTKWTEFKNNCKQYFMDDHCWAQADGIGFFKFDECNNGQSRPPTPPPPKPTPTPGWGNWKPSPSPAPTPRQPTPPTPNPKPTPTPRKPAPSPVSTPNLAGICIGFALTSDECKILQSKDNIEGALEILNLQPEYTIKQLDKARRKLALYYQPDKCLTKEKKTCSNEEREKYTEIMKKINECYDLLTIKFAKAPPDISPYLMGAERMEAIKIQDKALNKLTKKGIEFIKEFRTLPGMSKQNLLITLKDLIAFLKNNGKAWDLQFMGY